MIDQNTYKFSIDGIPCPIDGQVIKYDVTWIVEGFVQVELLMEWVEEQVHIPMFQEDFTSRFWEKWSDGTAGYLKVEGEHSGVRIISEVGMSKYKP